MWRIRKSKIFAVSGLFFSLTFNFYSGVAWSQSCTPAPLPAPCAPTDTVQCYTWSSSVCPTNAGNCDDCSALSCGTGGPSYYYNPPMFATDTGNGGICQSISPPVDTTTCAYNGCTQYMCVTDTISCSDPVVGTTSTATTYSCSASGNVNACPKKGPPIALGACGGYTNFNPVSSTIVTCSQPTPTPTPVVPDCTSNTPNINYSNNLQLGITNGSAGTFPPANASSCTGGACSATWNCAYDTTGGGSGSDCTYGSNYVNAAAITDPQNSNNAYCCATYPTITSSVCVGQSPTPTASPTPPPVGGTPPPVVGTPTPSPIPSCLDTGGSGRTCNTDSDCCNDTINHFSCAVVGNQPLKQSVNNCPNNSPSCIYGVNWANNVSGNGTDALTSGMMIPGGQLNFSGPTKMCVDSTTTRYPPWAGGNPAPTKLLMPASTAGLPIDPTLISWSGSAFICNLQDNDLHRMKNGSANFGCACDPSAAAPYEPFVVSKNVFNVLTYNVHMGRPSLDKLWIEIAALIHNNELARDAANQFFKGSDKIISTSQAGSGPLNCVGQCNDSCTDGSIATCTVNGGLCGCGGGHGSLVPRSTFAFYPNTYNFGSVAIGASGTSQIITVSGLGSPGGPPDTGCTLTSSDTANFTVVDNDCGSGGDGNVCSFNLNANPLSAGSFSTNVNITCGYQIQNGSGVYVNRSYGRTSGAYTVSTPCVVDGNTCATGVIDDMNLGPNYCGDLGPLNCTTCCTGNFYETDINHQGAQKCGRRVATCGTNGPTPTPTPPMLGPPSPTPTPPIVVSPTPTFTPTPSPTPSPTPPGMTPTPTPASTTPTPTALYVDTGAWPAGTLPYSSTGTTYGMLTTQGTNPSDVTLVNQATQTVACVRQCPVDPAHVWVATRDNSDPTVPPTCTCSNGYSFDNIAWTCKPCPVGANIVGGFCVFPPGYQNIGGFARPKKPSNEYVNYTNPNPVFSGYPICGSGTTPQDSRLPMTYGMAMSNVSGSTLPLTLDSTTIGVNTYDYSHQMTNGTSIYPGYAYANLPHCGCGGYVYDAPPAPKVPFGIAPTLSGVPSMSGDTLDFITSMNSSGSPNKIYGMVAISNIPGNTSDPRNGPSFTANPQTSFCGCPNVNEYPKLVGGKIQCTSVLGNDPNAIFTTFNAGVDDYNGKSQVYTKTTNAAALPNSVPNYKEIVDGGNNVVPTISIPTSGGAPTSLATYNRHIWKCQIGYTLDMAATPPTCKWLPTHACDNGSISGIPSPVGSTTMGPAPTFDTIVNKKLACCMNNKDANTITSADVKFDCIDNNALNTGNFDALWDSSDLAIDGGNMNAVLLASANGKPMTGFYTLDGARCSDLSEFDPAGIATGIVNPLSANMANQQNMAGGVNTDTFTQTGTIAAPTASLGYTALLAGLKVKKAPHPGTPTENAKARRCPILVRAALVASCPSLMSGNNAIPNAVHNTVLKAGQTRCPAADSIQIHIRVEQVYEIAGSPKLQTVDTIVDRKSASNVSLDAIIRKKNGSTCLPGETSSNGGCHY